MLAIEWVGLFLISWSISTLFVHVLVISAVFLERKRAVVNAFYTIYMAGCFPDILALINGVFMYCGIIGFLKANLLNSTIVVYASQTVVWGARFSQMITVLLIASNRVTAIRFPLVHARIWKSTTQRVCTYLQITIMFILGYPLVAFIRPYFITSSFGGVVTQNGLVAAQRNVVYTGATILQFTHGLVVLVLYILILYYVRAEKRMTRRLSTFTSQVSSKHESTLHKLAMIVCIVEILSVVQQVVQTQILILMVAFCAQTPALIVDVQRDTATIIYIVRTVVYTSIPPYLLLIFSESVWKRVMVFFRGRGLVARNTRIFSMDTETQF